MNKLIYCLLGPTASGKTDIACQLIKEFPFEIISVDSAMIYRGLSIGSAKPDEAILKLAPHHLIDIRNPDENYSVSEFCEDVKGLVLDIFKRGHYPLLVGGTMMYFRSLIQGLSVLPSADGAIREALELEALQLGWGALHDRLKSIDRESAQRIHPNDSQRIQRALEVYTITGRPMSSFLSEQTPVPFSFVNLVLFPNNRAWLHERIATRFMGLLEAGFIEEVRQILLNWPKSRNTPAMRSVGYRQVMAYLDGEIDASMLALTGIAATRQLAKRQLTWLRKWPDAYYFDPIEPSCYLEIVALINKIMDNSSH